MFESGERKTDSGNEACEGQQSTGLIRVGDCPPGVELEERQFITDPRFHSVGVMNWGGPNSTAGRNERTVNRQAHDRRRSPDPAGRQTRESSLGMIQGMNHANVRSAKDLGRHESGKSES